MVRTQISLPAEDHRRAKRRAAELGVSLAEYVRRTLAQDLEQPQPEGDISRIFGLFGSGGSDIAKHKDEYIGAAVEAQYLEETSRRRD